MEKADWKKKIKAACEGVGTYRAEFDNVVDTLADILAARDKVHAQYIKSGGNAVINYTNKGGATNLVKNPLLAAVNELNRDALSYWRDLGLTPSGLKKIREDEFIKEPEASDNIQRLVEMLGDD